MDENQVSDETQPNAQPESTPDSDGQSNDATYLREELKKVIGQRDALKAEKREREAAEAQKAEAAHQATLSLEERLKESESAYAKLKADVRTDAIKRELLAGVPSQNHEAVITIYTANEVGLNLADLSPAEVAAKARGFIGQMAPVLMTETEAKEAEAKPETTKEPEAKPAPQKLKGLRPGESPDEHLRPDVRAAKAQAAFRKRFPGFGSGHGL